MIAGSMSTGNGGRARSDPTHQTHRNPGHAHSNSAHQVAPQVTSSYGSSTTSVTSQSMECESPNSAQARLQIQQHELAVLQQHMTAQPKVMPLQSGRHVWTEGTSQHHRSSHQATSPARITGHAPAGLEMLPGHQMVHLPQSVDATTTGSVNMALPVVGW